MAKEKEISSAKDLKRLCAAVLNAEINIDGKWVKQRDCVLKLDKIITKALGEKVYRWVKKKQ